MIDFKSDSGEISYGILTILQRMRHVSMDFYPKKQQVFKNYIQTETPFILSFVDLTILGKSVVKEIIW